MSKDEQKNEIQLLDILLTLAKHKAIIFKLVFSITLASLVISLLWPTTYKSSAVILPPVQQQALSGLGGMLGGLLPMNLGTSPQINPENILSILNSRSLRVELIHEFNLQEVYNSEITEELLLKLQSNLRIEEHREGGFGFNPIISVRIDVIDKDPQRAQEMADFLVQRLDEIVNDINQANALEQFNLISERYHRNLEEMEEAEMELKEFQETYGIIEVEEQAKAIIQTLGEIKALKIETEMAINVMSQTVSENNPELRNLRRSLTELERQYQRFIQKSNAEARKAEVMPAVLDFPDLALNYYRLFREVTVQNKIYENLYPQYDIQKLQLEADKRGIQVLDEAHLPTYKDAPKRAFIVLGGMVFSIFLALLIVFYRHTMETNPMRHQQIKELQSHFRLGKKKQDFKED
ncbi:GNVR domain-containing protein [Balneolaceae bacterium ANBcel3]|nr:GNVR domain-containing protein [Balneolaceae bacterium ANBcel3]